MNETYSGLILTGRMERFLIGLVRARAWLTLRVYTAGSLAVITRPDGRLLLVKPWYRRAWGFPGGFFRRHEQPHDAVARELREEIGLDVSPDDAPMSFVQPGARHWENVFFLRLDDADLAGLRPDGREIRRMAWFRREDLPRLQREAAEILSRMDESAME